MSTPRKIKRVITLLSDKSERYWGFRVTRCSDGRSVEANTTSGGQSNIMQGLTSDGKKFLYDYYLHHEIIPQNRLFCLPYSGCMPEQIREYVRKGLRTRVCKKD